MAGFPGVSEGLRGVNIVKEGEILSIDSSYQNKNKGSKRY